MQGPESGAWGGPGQAGPLHPWELRQPGPFPRESVGEQATVVPSCPSHPSPSLGHKGHKRFCLRSLLLGKGWGLQAEPRTQNQVPIQTRLSCCQKVE